MLGVSVFWKVQIQPYIASDYTDVEIGFMYKSVNKNKVIRRYMESPSLHTGAPTVHLEDNIHCIYVVEEKIVTHRVRKIGIPILFIQE